VDEDELRDSQLIVGHAHADHCCYFPLLILLLEQVKRSLLVLEDLHPTLPRSLDGISLKSRHHPPQFLGDVVTASNLSVLVADSVGVESKQKMLWESNTKFHLAL
jgi:hypothetical protein